MICPQCLREDVKILKFRCTECEQANKVIRTAVPMYGPHACLTRPDLVPYMAYAYQAPGKMPTATKNVFKIVLEEPNAKEILEATELKQPVDNSEWLIPYLAYAYTPAIRIHKAMFIRNLNRNETVCSICWSGITPRTTGRCKICDAHINGLRAKNPAFVMRGIKRFAAAPGVIPDDIVDILEAYQSLVDVHGDQLTMLRRNTINAARRKLRDSHSMPLTRIESDVLLEVSKCQRTY